MRGGGGRGVSELRCGGRGWSAASQASCTDAGCRGLAEAGAGGDLGLPPGRGRDLGGAGHLERRGLAGLPGQRVR